MEATPNHRPQMTCIDRIVPMCEFCRRVYAARPGEPLDGPPQMSVLVWTDLRTFFKGRVIHHAQIVFARTYCEDCRRSYDLAVQYRESQ